jgi:hypothetical protein
MQLRATIFLTLLVAIAFSPLRMLAQQSKQAKDWRCVRQAFLETSDGDVVVMQCLAALPKDEKLDAEDSDLITRLEIIRANAQTFSSPTANRRDLIDTLRMGFGQTVGQICQKHPNIVLAPLFLTMGSASTKLYGCKNIITAPEK